jgi:hypothetical protein
MGAATTCIGEGEHISSSDPDPDPEPSSEELLLGDAAAAATASRTGALIGMALLLALAPPLDDDDAPAMVAQMAWSLELVAGSRGRDTALSGKS